MISDLTFSPLVSTEHGVGFLDQATGELHRAFGVHVSPLPRCFFAVTEAEMIAFYAHRSAVRVQQGAYYDRRRYQGD